MATSDAPETKTTANVSTGGAPLVVTDAGAIAVGGDVNVSGVNAAGRDLHIGEQHIHLPEPARELPTPNQLPGDIVSFTGRADVLAEMRGYLTEDRADSSPVAIAAVSGRPGVGKTALGVRAAHMVRSAFPQGQLYVNLRGSEAQQLDSFAVLADFLRALGVDGAAIPTTMDGRQNLYRERLSGRRVLVVLDNAASSAQVSPLLPGSGTCGVIVTSRRVLATLEGARLFRLDVLDPKHSVELLAKVIGAKRVAAETAAGAEIARLVGNLPLALRIVAARLAERPQLRLQKIVKELSDERRQLDALEVVDTPDWEVRASFALSYRELGDEERKTFRRLGLLRSADFTSWRAAALLDCSLQVADRLIGRLVSAQLLDESRPDALEQVRYRFHDLLRAYARECLAQDDSPEELRAALVRAGTALLRLALRAARHLEPGETHVPDAPGWWRVEDEDLEALIDEKPLTWFIVERRSLTTAVEYTAEAGEYELTWLITSTLPGFFDFQSRWDEWERTHVLALEAARRSDNELAEARLLRHIGRLHRYRARWEEAERACKDSAALARDRDPEAEADAQVELIRLYWYLGRWEDAKAAFERGLELFQAVANGYGEAKLRHSMGLVWRAQGRSTEALACFHAALPVFRAVGDARWVAATLWSLAEVHLDQGCWADAEACAGEAIAHLRKQQNRWWGAVVVRALAEAYAGQGRWEDAEASIDWAVDVLQTLGNSFWQAVASIAAAPIYRHRNRPEDAREALDRAVEIFGAAADRRWAAIANCAWGDQLSSDGQWGEAHLRFQAAEIVFDEIGDEVWSARALTGVGSTLLATGDVDGARAAWSEAQDVFERLGSYHVGTTRELLAAHA